MNGKKIAKILGISPSAVSLALNGKPGVSQSTREKVLAEAARQGFTVQGQPVIPEKRNIRYVIFVDEGKVVKETSFYSIVLQGVERKAKELGYNVLISYFYAGNDWTLQLIDIMKDTSGLIILGTEMKEFQLRKLTEIMPSMMNIPVVLVDKSAGMFNVDCVMADPSRGAHLAVSHLLGLGHRRIGYFHSKNTAESFEKRMAAYQQAWKESAAFDKNSSMQLIDVGTSSDQAYNDLTRWLDDGGKPLSAYIADNDIIAAACIRALKNHGYQVPDDISVIGNDDMPLCTLVDPPLTTVCVRKEQMGEIAAKILYERMSDHLVPMTDEQISVYVVTISTNLILRETTSPYKERK